ncbi:MAG: hypothetical protein FWD37_00915 [Methanomassiliicoccaceae archaeon]|nr:hypothetical protein [Methanomassiliicoccaceae archaeon]
MIVVVLIAFAGVVNLLTTPRDWSDPSVGNIAGNILFGIVIPVGGSLLGLFILFLVLFPKASAKMRTIKPHIKSNEITLTFYDDKMNINVSGGESGDVYYRYTGIVGYQSANDIRYYGNEDWDYQNVKILCVGDFFLVVTNPAFEHFDHGIVFKRSDISVGDPALLKKLLKDRMGKNFKEIRY